mmetsp:Transcript_15273/g.46636  ORF Transcript_15273/g.46636 Transcript_15273/m.46636 type:complete len:124 (-) Transcript_15273:413-784(-)
MGIGYLNERLDVERSDEEDVYAFLETLCEAPDEELYDRFQIAHDSFGKWEALPASDPDERRVDIRKWHSLSMRDVCTFAIEANDDLLVAGLNQCRDKSTRVECTCAHARLCSMTAAQQQKDET